MIASDLEVGGIDVGAGATKQNVFPGGLDEVVVNLQGARREIPKSSAHGGRVGTGAGTRHTIEPAKIRIDHGNESGTVISLNPFAGLSAFGWMEPIAVEDYVVSAFGRHNGANPNARLGDPLQANKAVVISNVGRRSDNQG